MNSRARRPGTPVALVTGATGFVGGHLIHELRTKTDWEVVGLARSESKFSSDVRILRCDLRDPDAIEKVVARYKPAYVFHLASQSYVPQSIASPADTLQNNILGQVHLLEALRTAGNSPVVLVVSSGEVYGGVTEDELPIREDQPFRPRNPYAVSKATQDLLGYQYFVSHGLRTVRVRPFNHVGPGQDDRFVVAAFARQIVEVERGRIEPTILTGNLDVERDFLDVRDVVKAYRLLAEVAPAGEVFNVASGRPRKVGDILDKLVRISGVDIEVARDPARIRQGEASVVFGDASRLQERTGWRPEVDLGTTLADTLDWWRSRAQQAGT